MSYQAQYITAAVAAVGVVGGAYCAYRVYQEAQMTKLPQEWTQVGTLKNIYAYPVKSCAPVLLNTAECTTLGLKDGWLRDRILMIVDEKNNFLTARACPELLLIKTNVRNSILTLTHVDMEPLHVNLAEVNALKEPKPAYVWGVEVPVRDCGWEASEWLSRLIDRSAINYRLVYYASQDSRKLRSSTNKIYKFTKNDTGALPDEVPYNLINEASVEDLNSRLLDCQVTHRNFRPNFVLSGRAKPYEEDNWKFVKIGNVIFEIIKPCTRCVLTTIDPAKRFSKRKHLYILDFIVETSVNVNLVFAKAIPQRLVNASAATMRTAFFKQFKIPGVIGCIDGTLVSMIRPQENEERYFCRKGYHARNVLIINDNNLNILHVDATFGGATHDNFIFNSSVIKNHLEQLYNTGETAYLLGDSGYAQRPYVMTPCSTPDQGTPEEYYNMLHSTARNSVERTIGVLKGRFRCLLVHRVLHYDPEMVSKIVIACCVLHNLCNRSGLPFPALPHYLQQREQRAMEILQRQQTRLAGANDLDIGRQRRQQLINRLWRARQ